jgi:hypothetical protein
MIQVAAVNGVAVTAGARGMAFNADGVAMVTLINVGTEVKNLR